MPTTARLPRLHCLSRGHARRARPVFGDPGPRRDRGDRRPRPDSPAPGGSGRRRADALGFLQALPQYLVVNKAPGSLHRFDQSAFVVTRWGAPDRFHAALIENEDGPGPFGSKGIAQTTIGCGAPAIGNAIHDAIGVYVDSLPYTPEKILRALAVLPSDAATGGPTP